MKMSYIVMLFSFAIIGVLANAQCYNDRYTSKLFSQVLVTKNIEYAKALNSSGIKQSMLMDMYEPKGDTLINRPLIIFFHGGAYWTGTKNYQSNIAMGNEFAKRGYVFCSASYRLEPSPLSLLNEDKMIRAVGRGVQDVKNLVRYIYDDIRGNNQFRIDTNLIFLAGASAGAFNVLHTVFLDNQDTLPLKWQQNLMAIGGVFDEYDFIDFGERMAGMVNINGALGDVNYMNNESLSFLSVHNTGDPEIPFNIGKPYSIPFLPTVYGSNVLHQRAAELEIENPFYIIYNNGHTSFSSDFFGTVVQPYFDSTVWYMNKYFTTILCDRISPIYNYKNASLNFYPNPNKGVFNIDIPDKNQKKYIIEIITLDGRVLLRENIEYKNEHYILHFPLQDGNYILSLLDSEHRINYTVKLLVLN